MFDWLRTIYTTYSLVLTLAALVEKQNRHLEKIMASLDQLVESTRRLNTITDSVVNVLVELKQQLKDQGLDPVKVDEAFANVEMNIAELTAAITENTPAEGSENEPGAGSEEPPSEP